MKRTKRSHSNWLRIWNLASIDCGLPFTNLALTSEEQCHDRSIHRECLSSSRRPTPALNDCQPCAPEAWAGQVRNSTVIEFETATTDLGRQIKQVAHVAMNCMLLTHACSLWATYKPTQITYYKQQLVGNNTVALARMMHANEAQHSV